MTAYPPPRRRAEQDLAELRRHVERLLRRPLTVPVHPGDPADVVDGMVWINAATGLLSWRVGGATRRAG